MQVTCNYRVFMQIGEIQVGIFMALFFTGLSEEAGRYSQSG